MKAVIVTGPEGCGNRLVAAAFNLAGCHGAGSTDEPLNTSLPDGESPVVLIRSYPHGDKWPDLRRTILALRARGYDVTVVVACRDVFAYAGSWVKDRPEEAWGYDVNYDRAYRDIFAALSATGARYILSPYEAATARPAQYLPRLVRLCGVPCEFPADLVLQIDGKPRTVSDANGKYY